MNGLFYMSAARLVVEDHYLRAIVNAGVSQADMDIVKGPALWSVDQRVRLRQTLDTMMYAVTEMVGLPRVDIPAEMFAAIVASLVSPINWAVCASWQSGLRAAKDILDTDETAQIERVSPAKMLTMIFAADAAMRGDPAFTQFASSVAKKYNAAEKAIVA
ncbi:MAG: hypothetical protein LCH61_04155 [Proteobacteria bacterium]|nr:hypothetical protein [Pseudomonadota bacterium]